MTIPEHVIEAASRAFAETTGYEFTHVDFEASGIGDGLEAALSAGFASLWQPLESAETQDWSSDSWTLPVKVATDDEGNPLFLVYYESKDSGYWRATKWMPLPLPKGSE